MLKTFVAASFLAAAIMTFPSATPANAGGCTYYRIGHMLKEKLEHFPPRLRPRAQKVTRGCPAGRVPDAAKLAKKKLPGQARQ
jgi:hypothetical protein